MVGTWSEHLKAMLLTFLTNAKSPVTLVSKLLGRWAVPDLRELGEGRGPCCTAKKKRRMTTNLKLWE